MTDHTEMQIPDDVMQAAILAYEECRGFDDGREYDIIARAILAERERMKAQLKDCSKCGRKRWG